MNITCNFVSSGSYCIEVGAGLDLQIHEGNIENVGSSTRCFYLEDDANLDLVKVNIAGCGGPDIDAGGGIYARKGNKITADGCTLFNNGA